MVVDTNVVASCFFQGKFSTDAIRLLALLTNATVPPLWQSEFRNVLSLYLRKQLITIDAALEIYALAEQRLLVVHAKNNTFQVLDLVNRSTCSAYDCEFVALAQQLESPLVTQDKKLLREFPGTAINISNALMLVQKSAE